MISLTDSTILYQELNDEDKERTIHLQEHALEQHRISEFFKQTNQKPPAEESTLVVDSSNKSISVIKNLKNNTIDTVTIEQNGKSLKDYYLFTGTDRIKPYAVHKKQSHAIAMAMCFIPELMNRGMNIHDCASFMKFLECPTSDYHPKYLANASFCHDRLCLNCNAVRALKAAKECKQVARLIMLNTQPPLEFSMMTLTAKNVKAEDFQASVDLFFDSWHNRLLKNKRFKQAIEGTFRGFEVTYNRKNDTYHPHFHVLVAVKPSYFHSDNYISQAELADMWRKALTVDYNVVVNVKKIYNKRKIDYLTEPTNIDHSNDALFGAINEVAKYVLKPSSLPTDDFVLLKKVLQVLAPVLKGRRLYAYTGIMLKYQKILNEHKEKAILPCNCKICQALLVFHQYNYQEQKADFIG